MRLLFVTSTPLNVQQGSGTFVGISTLAAAQRSLGVAVDFITPTLRFPIYTFERLIFNESLRFRRLGDCDVIVGFDMDGYSIANARRTLHVASIKGVIGDELLFESGLTNATMRLQAAFEKRHVHRAGLVITTSEYSSVRIQKLYGLPKPPRVVPELIDLVGWERLAAANPAPLRPGKFTVLSVCRFYPRKRLNLLLLAAARLRERIPGLEIRIVGGGPEAPRLKELCRRNRLESLVVWRENLSGAELAAEYNQCDLFCLPSVQEGFGLVFLEAMANGKCIVAARAAAVPEVVRHGLLADPDDDQSLAGAMERLYRDPDLRNSLASAGREFAKQFDAPVVAKLFRNELERALDEARPSARG